MSSAHESPYTTDVSGDHTFSLAENDEDFPSPLPNNSHDEAEKELSVMQLQSVKRSLLSVAFAPSLYLLAFFEFFSILHSVIFQGVSGIKQSVPLGMILWLCSHLLPITINNVTLSFIPLLALIALLFVVRWYALRAANEPSTYGDPRLVVAVSTGGAIFVGLFIYTVLGMIYDTSPLEIPNIFLVVSSIFLVHAVGACWGIMKSQRGGKLLVPAQLHRIVYSSSFSLALRYTKMLCIWTGVIGLIFVLLRIIWMWEFWEDIAGPNPAASLPLNILSFAYIPNFIIFAIQFLMGDTIQIGHGLSSIMHVHNDPQLPLVPASVILPHHQVYSWWIYLPALFFLVVIPIGIGVARESRGVIQIIRVTAYIAVLSGVTMGILSFIAAGEIGLRGKISGSPAYCMMMVFLGVLSSVGLSALLSRLAMERFHIMSYRKEIREAHTAPPADIDMLTEEELLHTFDIDGHTWDSFEELGPSSREILINDMRARQQNLADMDTVESEEDLFIDDPEYAIDPENEVEHYADGEHLDSHTSHHDSEYCEEPRALHYKKISHTLNPSSTLRSWWHEKKPLVRRVQRKQQVKSIEDGYHRDTVQDTDPTYMVDTEYSGYSGQNSPYPLNRYDRTASLPTEAAPSLRDKIASTTHKIFGKKTPEPPDPEEYSVDSQSADFTYSDDDHHLSLDELDMDYR